MVSTCSEVKPVLTDCNRRKLRNKSPAPASSTTDKAHLADNQETAQAVVSPAARSAASALLQRLLNVGPRDLQRRRQAKQNSGQDRRDERETQPRASPALSHIRRGKSCGKSLVSSATPHKASSSPATPPTRASIRLSVSNCAGSRAGARRPGQCEWPSLFVASRRLPTAGLPRSRRQ